MIVEKDPFEYMVQTDYKGSHCFTKQNLGK